MSSVLSSSDPFPHWLPATAVCLYLWACLPHHYQSEPESETKSKASSAEDSPSIIDIISFVRRADNVLYIYLILHSAFSWSGPESRAGNREEAESEAMAIYLRVRGEQPSVISDFLCQFTRDQSSVEAAPHCWLIQEPAPSFSWSSSSSESSPTSSETIIDQKQVCFSFPHTEKNCGNIEGPM